jgi:hypothetical protein
VRVANGKTQVLDGPYAESKEQLGGFHTLRGAGRGRRDCLGVRTGREGTMLTRDIAEFVGE